MLLPSITVRRITNECASVLLVSALLSGCAQQQPAVDKTAMTVANTIAGTINRLSCGRFVAMVQRMAPVGAAATPNPVSSPGRMARMGSRIAGIATAPLLNTLKTDAATRAEFVNTVAGPLVNKMIDCDVLPFGT
jgi:hypothetical protein